MSACEAEVKMLGDRYSDLFFAETPFNDVAIDDDTYLIIGRRGAGKTALSRYLSFQGTKPNPIYIDVSRPDIYQEVLSEISRRASASRPAAVAHLKRVWEYLIWSLIAQALSIRVDGRSVTSDGHDRPGRLSNFIADAIQQLMDLLGDSDDRSLGTRIDRVWEESNLDLVKQAAFRVSELRAVIIAMDTLEQYDVKNEPLMNALAGLIEYAADFNLEYSAHAIHLKLFISGEVFPHLRESVLLNPLKVVKHPVYLLWRPRDLLRLIGWRFYRYLDSNGQLVDDALPVRWDSDEDVLAKVWRPYFGTTFSNEYGVTEETWPYVLRHTQMRPRQVITICNAIANRAIRDGSFPGFSRSHIIDGVEEASLDLASEVLNSYYFWRVQGVPDIPNARLGRAVALVGSGGENQEASICRVVDRCGVGPRSSI